MAKKARTHGEEGAAPLRYGHMFRLSVAGRPSCVSEESTEARAQSVEYQSATWM
jgi:hypothetical protein